MAKSWIEHKKELTKKMLELSKQIQKNQKTTESVIKQLKEMKKSK